MLLNIQVSEQLRNFNRRPRIMKKKLTLVVEEEVIKKAGLYAERTGKSLSELVGRYLETLGEEGTDTSQLSPKLKKLVGAVKLPANFDEKKELRAYLDRKHL
ncbi:hypothetical protein PBAL39_12523 [Pedobacter sp. BAL39]|nr:hypothetical protein PBAL39_12523 [Pedobacter sp. BAL39]